jgi:hypothetical protein
MDLRPKMPGAGKTHPFNIEFQKRGPLSNDFPKQKTVTAKVPEETESDLAEHHGLRTGDVIDPPPPPSDEKTDPAKESEATETTSTGEGITKSHEPLRADVDALTSSQIASTATGITTLKVARQKRKYTKRAKVPVAEIAFKDELFEGDVQQVHGWRSQSRRELWQRGHLTASRPSRIAQEVALVMCDTVKDCHTSMRMHGWAILRDVSNAFGPKQQCTEQQRAFIDDYKIDSGLEVVFEDVIMNDRADHYTPSFDSAHVNARVQLDMGRTGYQDIRAIYTRKYEEQLQNIIGGYDLFEGDTAVPFDGVAELAPRPGKKLPTVRSRCKGVKTGHVDGMFPGGSEASKSVNWKYAQTILRGGVNYQHPHSDTARVNSYAGHDIFPFVCIHAFGQEPFSMWLGPGLPTRSYGFLHTFDAKNMLFMRGDFIHAGAVGTTPRAHMEFFPLEGAGWTRKKSPWTYTAASNHDKFQPTYLWQLPTCPFGYPSVSSPDHNNGNMLVTYPVRTTTLLRLPFTPKMCVYENIEYKEDSTAVLEGRRKEARRIDGQEW